MSEKFKSGYVALVGLPNAGKSTFLNKVLDCKLAPVSRKPQTTRTNLLGIFNTNKSQILFIDTPGFHTIDKELNKFFVKEAIEACNNADIILYFFDPVYLEKKSIDDDKKFFSVIKDLIKSKKVIPLVSKIDLVKKKTLKDVQEKINEIYNFGEKLYKISVNQSIGIVPLLSYIESLMPEGDLLYPDDYITDKNIRFLCSELIREKIFKYTHKEIPYSTAVQIIKYEEGEKLHRIFADIYVERESQKGIVVGKKGELIKRIGSSARADIEDLVGTKVYLELFVKLRKDWSTDKSALKEFGYK